ncbi:MAG TPA: amino acid ABC transporter permease [Beutenbergiaceae bacterium]|nr:amino acid ABC transporter permease [Beutenbergiaceae bacterium]
MSATHSMFDTVGPRAQRWVRIVTAASVLFLLGLFAVAYWRFYESGALAPSRWYDLYQPHNVRYLGNALVNTAKAAAGAAAIALPLGLVLAVGRLSTRWWWRWPCAAVVELFRAVPVLLVIYIFMFALPAYGFDPDVYWKLVLPIALCASAILAEVFRAGVLALPKGQNEAALAVGMTKGQAFRQVVFPQALRLVVPALVAQAVIVVKDTAFGYVVSYAELMHSGRVLVSNTGNLVQTYLVITVVYILVNVIISQVAQRLDVALARRRSGRSQLSLLAGRFGRRPAP